MIDALARELGIEPHEMRLANLVQPEEMPFDNITKKHFDSGDYPEAVRRAVDAHRRRRNARTSEAERARRRGASASASPSTASRPRTAPVVYYGWGIPMVPGHEQCAARLTPDGVLELRIGAHSHGQGMETTLAQVANTILGIDPSECPSDPRRHGIDALLHRHLGLALHGDVGRRRGGGVRRDRRAREGNCVEAPAKSPRERRSSSQDGCVCVEGTDRRLIASAEVAARLVSPAAAPARRRRPGGPRSDRGLQGEARHRHLQLCLPRGGRGGRHRDRRRSRSSTTSSSRTAARW